MRLDGANVEPGTRFVAIGDPEVQCGEQNDGCDDALRPDAVDAPLLNHILFKIGEDECAEATDLCGLKGEEIAAQEREDGDQNVADDADGGDGDVALAVGVFI